MDLRSTHGAMVPTGRWRGIRVRAVLGLESLAHRASAAALCWIYMRCRHVRDCATEAGVAGNRQAVRTAVNRAAKGHGAGSQCAAPGQCHGAGVALRARG